MADDTWTPYRPSNGTEGMSFIAHWCDNCRKYRNGRCRILLLSMDCTTTDDPEYPKALVWNQRMEPKCTAFIDNQTPRGPRKPRIPKGQMPLAGIL